MGFFGLDTARLGIIYNQVALGLTSNLIVYLVSALIGLIAFLIYWFGFRRQTRTSRLEKTASTYPQQTSLLC